MGKNKLKKFAELEHNPLVLQYPFRVVQQEGFPLRGRWNSDFFHNDNPIVLELGCGKGEYTVGLARRYPDKNFIGIDIKGARMYTGATEALRSQMTNVAFVRTSIELIEAFFGPGEVAEIWITFPDPQMKKVNKRLTGTRMMESYRRILAPGGIVHLKTDSPFLYTYTAMMARHNGLPIEVDFDDLHNDAAVAPDSPLRTIRTHYEQQWIARGLTIKYLKIILGAEVPQCGAEAFLPPQCDQCGAEAFLPPRLSEPPGADDIPLDTYRSYSRGYLETEL